MKCIILLVSLCGLALADPRVDLVVSTNVGQIRGVREDEKGYTKFLGIPYGRVGRNIFGAAEPYPAFDDVFEAYDDSNVCVQVYEQVPLGTTDCLNLNIFVPDSESNEPLPVMLWMHGGAFVEGNANREARDPVSLLRHDVIVVAVNYRLGIFGFMCLDIPEVPGNTGLKDQVMALKWVKENIEAFGGDANQITMFGESAGAMSTNLHLFSPHEKLFERAIIQSGPANSYWMMVESNNTIPITLAGALGFTTTNIYEALEFLMDADPIAIAQTGHDLLISNCDGTNQPLTKPCVEQQFEGVESFLTDHPINIKSEKAITTPVIIGYNSIEFAFQYADVDATFFDTYHFSEHFAKGFHLNENITEAYKFVEHFYIGDEDITENVRWEIINFGSDFIFNHPTHRMAQKLMDDGATTVYIYVYAYDGEKWFGMDKSWTGATHAEELQYLFDLEQFIGEKTADDQLIIDRLTQLWTNFAKYGNPTPATSELVPVIWTPITTTTHPYLEIDLDVKLDNRPFNSRMAFWDLFYKKYGHYQKWYNAGVSDIDDAPPVDDEPSVEDESSGENEDNSSSLIRVDPLLYISLCLFAIYHALHR